MTEILIHYIKIFGFEMPFLKKKSALNVIGKLIPMKIQDFLGTNEKEGWNFDNITYTKITCIKG